MYLTVAEYITKQQSQRPSHLGPSLLFFTSKESCRKFVWFLQLCLSQLLPALSIYCPFINLIHVTHIHPSIPLSNPHNIFINHTLYIYRYDCQFLSMWCCCFAFDCTPDCLTNGLLLLLPLHRQWDYTFYFRLLSPPLLIAPFLDTLGHSCLPLPFTTHTHSQYLNLFLHHHQNNNTGH